MTDKERELEIMSKMDAINLMGPWLNFSRAGGGNRHGVAGRRYGPIIAEMARLRGELEEIRSRQKAEIEDDLSILLAI